MRGKVSAILCGGLVAIGFFVSCVTVWVLNHGEMGLEQYTPYTFALALLAGLMVACTVVVMNRIEKLEAKPEDKIGKNKEE